jgi:hypothetical protein
VVPSHGQNDGSAFPLCSHHNGSLTECEYSTPPSKGAPHMPMLRLSNRQPTRPKLLAPTQTRTDPVLLYAFSSLHRIAPFLILYHFYCSQDLPLQAPLTNLVFQTLTLPRTRSESCKLPNRAIMTQSRFLLNADPKKKFLPKSNVHEHRLKYPKS